MKYGGKGRPGTPAHILFLAVLLRRQGISTRDLTLIQGVQLLGSTATTEDGAKAWLRERWREMATETREVETLRRIRLSRTASGRAVLRRLR